MYRGKIILGAMGFLLLAVLFVPGANGEVKTNTQEVEAGDDLSISIQAGSGNIVFAWAITDWNDDNVEFYIESGSGGYVSQATDVSTYTDTIVVEKGYYTFVWNNNNILESFTLSYTIEYQSYAEEVEDEKGLCGGIMALAVIGFIGAVFALGTVLKRR